MFTPYFFCRVNHLFFLLPALIASIQFVFLVLITRSRSQISCLEILTFLGSYSNTGSMTWFQGTLLIAPKIRTIVPRGSAAPRSELCSSGERRRWAISGVIRRKIYQPKKLYICSCPLDHESREHEGSLEQTNDSQGLCKRDPGERQSRCQEYPETQDHAMFFQGLAKRFMMSTMISLVCSIALWRIIGSKVVNLYQMAKRNYIWYTTRSNCDTCTASPCRG